MNAVVGRTPLLLAFAGGGVGFVVTVSPRVRAVLFATRCVRCSHTVALFWQLRLLQARLQKTLFQLRGVP